MIGYCGMVIPEPQKQTTQKTCMLIAWGPEDKKGNPRPNCPECGKPGELDMVMGMRIGYFHKMEKKS